MKATDALSNYKQNSRDGTVDVEVLVRNHKSLVDKAALSIAKGLPEYIDIDDLKQVGFIGLIKAAKSYEGKNDAKFTTYAYYRIRGSIYDEIRSSDWKPRRSQQRTKLILTAIATIENECEGTPTDEMIARHLDISVDEYYSWIKETSINQMVHVEDQEVINNVSDGEDISEGVDREDMKLMIRSAVSKLPQRDAQIVSLYYLEDLSFKDIAYVMDMNATTCSRIFKSSLLQIKAILLRMGLERG